MIEDTKKLGLFLTVITSFVWCSLIQSPTALNISEVIFEENKEKYFIQLIAQGGSGTYQFIYDGLPSKWRAEKQNIQILKQSLQLGKKYPINLTVIDSQKNQFKAMFFFRVGNQNIQLTEIEYPYQSVPNDNFLNLGGQSSLPQIIKSENNQPIGSKSLNNKKYHQKQGSIGKQYKQQIIKFQDPNRPISSEPHVYNSIININQSSKQKNNTEINNQMPLKIYQTSNQTQGGSKMEQILDSNSSQIFGVAIPIQKNDSKNKIAQTNQQKLAQNTQKRQDQNQEMVKNIQELDIKGDQNKSNKNNIKTNSSSQSQIKLSKIAYIKFPLQKQLIQLISANNIIELLKIIAQVSGSNEVSCEYKTQYLNNLANLMKRNAMSQKYIINQFQITKESSIIAQNLIIQQLSRIEVQKQQLSLEKMRRQFNQDMEQLNNKHNQLNQAFDKLDPFKKNIESLQNTLKSNKVKSKLQRQQLIRQRLSYNQADFIVKRLQKQLENAQQRKKTIVEIIFRFQTQLMFFQQFIDKNQNKLIEAESQMKLVQNKIQQLKINYKKSQFNVQKLKRNLAKVLNDERVKQQQKYRLEDELSFEKKKLVKDQLIKLQQMVERLQANIPNLQQLINKTFMKCYKTESFIQEISSNSYLYIIEVSNFQKYIAEAYQVNVEIKDILPKNVKIKLVNIMDSQWQVQYGNPYDIFSYANATDFSFHSGFNCLNRQGLRSDLGKISKIDKNFIQVINSKNETSKLILGSCTRIQTTSLLPSIGQTIFWRARFSNVSNQFYTHRILCV